MRMAMSIVVLGFVCLAPSLPGGEKKTDKDLLQGTWKPTSIVRDGQEISDVGDLRISFKGVTFKILKDGEEFLEGTITLNSTKKPPTIDFSIQKGADEFSGKNSKAIYAIKGNTFKFCATKPGVENRPTEFAAPQGSDAILVTLERVKK
jgi:uncharacterized protein (TIGR03067 family)